jgi:hypothetical protein
MLANAPAASAPRAGECPLNRVPRAPRFRIRLEVHWWLASDLERGIGVTENVSRSGVLFRAERALDLNIPIKMILVLPGTVAGEPPGRLRCHGHTVRVVWPPVPSMRPVVAATVGDYRLSTLEMSHPRAEFQEA